ncbi:uncharacterized protein F4822DRAFT_424717 [Hypoxylon trugodes]|uniref:uncharacterized protein n=1 Tax=Hypoxylon trugodes TaxID=326681 RepID=UPI00218D1000|nr:uncharacterized protein F4822DRAFT_424717 [Hypoxylon trugodes]KAI1394239.1 hypothetical protein F4822DRAFT_424717 [Hypoxylon trugodes]
MSGLIPLLLPSSAGSRSSMNSSPIEANRRASVSSSLSPSSSPPPSLIHRRQQSLPTLRATKRGSLSLPTTIPIIPFTSMEWKRAIDEVKRKYLNRKYRACSARCCEILDNLKDSYTVEPLYLIYLHFYAACSFELCARPLSCSSNYRTRLLRDAQIHYNKAEALIRHTEENVTRRIRSASSSSSTTSSLHSPGLSPSVRSSVSSTTLSSPRTSVCSVDDTTALKSSGRPVKAKKKVSFSGLNDLIEFQPEPYIRPDSPTLGWEDDFVPQHNESTLPLFLADKINPPKPELSTESEPPRTTTTIGQSLEELNHADDKFDLDTFLQSRSVHRISAQLSALRLQVSWHRNGVEALLAAPDDTPATPTLLTDNSVVPSTPITPPRSARANTLPTSVGRDSDSPDESAPWTAPGLRYSFAHSPSYDSPRALSRPASVASTIRCTDEALQQRIERLRANGWQRKRFDSRRYEVLREQVLGELGA